MITFMKIKYPLILILFGLLASGLGPLFKIEHLPFADVLILLGLLASVIGIFWLLSRLFRLLRQGS